MAARRDARSHGAVEHEADAAEHLDLSHGAMTLPLGALARTLAETSGARILASFAGPNYFSLLVAPGEGDALCAAWHTEFLDPR